jgi:hypothetical protein
MMLTDRELQSLRNLGNEAEAAADEIERLRAEVEMLREDAERLEYLMRHLPGDALRYVAGELADSGDIAEFRAAIDKVMAPNLS